MPFGAMVAGIVLIPLFQATSSWRTLFDLFLLWHLLYFSMAGVVLHVVQSPYRVLNWGPVVWLGKISYLVSLAAAVLRGPGSSILVSCAVGPSVCLPVVLPG
jgi:peptidoglycan/LPS O-acetylase OafA/YrhL